MAEPMVPNAKTKKPSVIRNSRPPKPRGLIGEVGVGRNLTCYYGGKKMEATMEKLVHSFQNFQEAFRHYLALLVCEPDFHLETHNTLLGFQNIWNRFQSSVSKRKFNKVGNIALPNVSLIECVVIAKAMPSAQNYQFKEVDCGCFY